MRKKLLRSRSGFEKPESREEAIMQNILGASNVLEPSESNIEEILKSILYNTPYTKEAEFEIEKILLAIKNNGTYNGEGESRDMKILIAILNDLDYTEEAESRIEELFIEWLQQRSQIKVLEGVPPLTFTARGLPLINYLIEGNTVQNGTPTPENPIMPQGTGERTGNLFDDFDIVGQVPSITNGELVNSVSGGTTSFIPLSTPLVSLTLFSSTMQTYLFLYDGNKTFIGQCTLTSVGTVSSSVITGYANAKYARIRSDKISLYDKNVTLVYGSTAPSEYIPYGYKIPISSANTTTPVYLGEVETTRRVKELVFDGTENWRLYSLSSAKNVERFYLVVSKNCISPGSIISSHFPTLTDNSDTEHTRCGGSSINEVYIYISRTVATNVVELKSYLAQQYAAGTPVCVWYVLATEETAVVNEPLMKIGDYADTLSKAQAGVEIPTVSGSNTLDVNTTVKPSNIYIEYK